jgi:hypothetical protein
MNLNSEQMFPEIRDEEIEKIIGWVKSIYNEYFNI